MITCSIQSEDTEQATKHDGVLFQVLQYTSQCWQNDTTHLPEPLKPYYLRTDQLTTEKGCVLWGVHVVMPVNDYLTRYMKNVLVYVK